MNARYQECFDKPESFHKATASEYSVKRKEALVKLREIKRITTEKGTPQRDLSFYKLLTDACYRESSLLKLSMNFDDAIADLARDTLKLDIQGSLLDDEPCLGEEVLVRLYPNQSIESLEIEKFSWYLPKMVFTLFASNSSR